MRFKRRVQLNSKVKQMKKLVLLLTAACIIVGAIGCSKPAEETGGTTATGSTGASDTKTPDTPSDK